MNILIVSNSLVVEELLKLVLKSKDYNLEFQKDVEDADISSYDIVFIDDSAQDLTSQIEFAQDGLHSKVALIASTNSDVEANYIITKPFLPQDIETILDNIESSKLSTKVTNILDPDEIAKIKELMQMDDEELEAEDSQEDIKNIDLLKDKKSIKLKKKDAKELLLELNNIDEKELKKLLKGAKVSIKIAYKKGKDE